MATEQARKEFETAKYYARKSVEYKNRARGFRSFKNRAKYFDAAETALRNARVMLENALEAR